MRIFGFLTSVLASFSLTPAFAATEYPILPPQEILQEAIEFNQQLDTKSLKFSDPAKPLLRPWAEVEPVKYVFINDAFSYGTERVKRDILRNLPADVLTVVLSTSAMASYTQSHFEQFISKDRFVVLEVPEADRAFWARDGLPVPVYSGTEDNKRLAAVDAKYYHNFNDDAYIAKYLQTELLAHEYYYEGGNFKADKNGNCFLINSGTGAKLPDDVLKSKYGCKAIQRLPYKKGIGHVDEVLFFPSEKIALTPVKDYAPTLEKLGYQVVLLPQPSNAYETYANSLLVNGTVFLPVYNQSKDQTAIDVYAKAGLKVVPIETITLSNSGMGSIHCITMAYPETSINVVAAAMLDSFSKWFVR